MNDSITFSNTILNDERPTNPITVQKATQINNMIKTLNSDGIVFASHELATFLQSHQTDMDAVSKIVHVFSKYTERIVLKQSPLFQPYCPESRKYGRVYYNKTIFNPISIPYVYSEHTQNQKLAAELDTVKKIHPNPEKIRQQVEKQSKLFPSSGTFDYRTIVTPDGSVNKQVLNGYFDKH